MWHWLASNSMYQRLILKSSSSYLHLLNAGFTDEPRHGSDDVGFFVCFCFYTDAFKFHVFITYSMIFWNTCTLWTSFTLFYFFFFFIIFPFQHQLCIREIFQGLDILKNQTVRGGSVETLFQNLSLIKKYIDRQKVSSLGALQIWLPLFLQEPMTVCSVHRSSAARRGGKRGSSWITCKSSLVWWVQSGQWKAKAELVQWRHDIRSFWKLIFKLMYKNPKIVQRKGCHTLSPLIFILCRQVKTIYLLKRWSFT